MDGYGPFITGSMNVTLTGAYGTMTGAVVVYPANGTTHRWDLPPNRTNAPYPAFTCTHGLGGTALDWRNSGLAIKMASWGFVVFLPQFDFSVQVPDEIAAWHSAALDWLVTKNATHGDTLEGMVLTSSFGAMGHSRGGRIVIAAAENDTRYAAVVPIAPANFSYSVPEKLIVPVQYEVGTLDPFVPQTYALYNRSSAPKYLIIINGMTHSVKGVLGDIALTYGLSFFEYYIAHNYSWLGWVYGDNVQQDTRIVFIYEIPTVIEHVAGIFAIAGCVALCFSIAKQKRKKKVRTVTSCR